MLIYNYYFIYKQLGGIIIASGRGHDKVTYITTPFIFSTFLIILNNINLTLIATVCYLFSGLMFSGDLDTDSQQQHRWTFLKFIWKPYSRIFKHRSFFTHGMFIATLIRIIYLWIWISIFLFIYKLGVFAFDNITIYSIINFFKGILKTFKEIINNVFDIKVFLDNFTNGIVNCLNELGIFFKDFYNFYEKLVYKIKDILVLYKKETIVIFIALSLGSLSHTLSDIVYSKVKYYVKKFFYKLFPKKKR